MIDLFTLLTLRHSTAVHQLSHGGVAKTGSPLSKLLKRSGGEHRDVAAHAIVLLWDLVRFRSGFKK